MKRQEFSFGSGPRMREVPLGKSAELKFSGNFNIVDTEWGEKYSFEVTLFSHPSYESIPKEGLKTTWESKSQVAQQLYNACEPDAIERNPDLAKAIKDNLWILARSEEGAYFINNKLTG
jgi:hypothetical protein